MTVTVHDSESLTAVIDFLPCQTPAAWIDYACQHLDILLIDHAHCEKKAASTALSLLYRYVDHTDLLHRLSRLAREELRHFEQVLNLLEKRKITYTHLSPSRYAEGLRSHVRTHEPYRLVDILLVGALVEARSCERFAALIPYLDDELATFYQSLLHSEAQHFSYYLKLAEQYSPDQVNQRLDFFKDIEKELIISEDKIFRFHSGIIL